MKAYVVEVKENSLCFINIRGLHHKVTIKQILTTSNAITKDHPRELGVVDNGRSGRSIKVPNFLRAHYPKDGSVAEMQSRIKSGLSGLKHNKDLREVIQCCECTILKKDREILDLSVLVLIRPIHWGLMPQKNSKEIVSQRWA